MGIGLREVTLSRIHKCHESITSNYILVSPSALPGYKHVTTITLIWTAGMRYRSKWMERRVSQGFGRRVSPVLPSTQFHRF